MDPNLPEDELERMMNNKAMQQLMQQGAEAGMGEPGLDAGLGAGVPEEESMAKTLPFERGISDELPEPAPFPGVPRGDVMPEEPPSTIGEPLGPIGAPPGLDPKVAAILAKYGPQAQSGKPGFWESPMAASKIMGNQLPGSLAGMIKPPMPPKLPGQGAAGAALGGMFGKGGGGGGLASMMARARAKQPAAPAAGGGGLPMPPGLSKAPGAKAIAKPINKSLKPMKKVAKGIGKLFGR